MSSSDDPIQPKHWRIVGWVLVVGAVALTVIGVTVYGSLWLWVVAVLALLAAVVIFFSRDVNRGSGENRSATRERGNAPDTEHSRNL